MTAFFLFAPTCVPRSASGVFTVAIAEFAVLGENGRLANADNQAGRQLAARVQGTLQQAFCDDAGIQVWPANADPGEEHWAEIGVVADDLAEATAPAAVADRLDAEVVVYGTLRPVVQAGDYEASILVYPLDPEFEGEVWNWDFEFELTLP